MTTEFCSEDTGVALLDLDFENETCCTCCGDSYYDYDILSFDDVFRLADYIKTRRKQMEGAKMVKLDDQEIDALIHLHLENIRELIEDMNDAFNWHEFNGDEMTKLMRSISNEIETVKYYKDLKNENRS